MAVQINDPVAQRYSWESNRPKSAMSVSRSFRMVNGSQAILENRMSTYTVYAVLGVIILVTSILFARYNNVDPALKLFQNLGYIVPVLYFLWIVPQLQRVHIIDHKKKLFWSNTTLAKMKRCSSQALETAVGVQLFLVHKGKSMAYELNIVLENGDRIYLFSDMEHKNAQQVGKKIARILTVPLWDATL